jgi:hypothetical protein
MPTWPVTLVDTGEATLTAVQPPGRFVCLAFERPAALVQDDLAGVTLGAAVLALHTAGHPLRGPVMLLRTATGDAGSDVSLGKILEHGLHHPYGCLQRWSVGCVTSMTRQRSATVLA